MAFSSKDKQRIIDGYLADTGKNLFVAAEFVDWLEEHPEHEAYDWFFGQGDTAAARLYRIELARKMASGLRVRSRIVEEQGSSVRVTERTFPAYLSPISGRDKGGGYQRFDPSSPESMAELRREGAVAMGQWLRRYRGAFEDIDLRTLERIAEEEEAVAAL